MKKILNNYDNRFTVSDIYTCPDCGSSSYRAHKIEISDHERRPVHSDWHCDKCGGRSKGDFTEEFVMSTFVNYTTLQDKIISIVDQYAEMIGDELTLNNAVFVERNGIFWIEALSYSSYDAGVDTVLIPLSVLWEGFDRLQADQDWRKAVQAESDAYRLEQERKRDLAELKRLKEVYPDEWIDA